MKALAVWALGAALSGLALAAQPAAAPGATLGQILEKNAIARGGVDAWRKIDAMVWVGHVESTNARAEKLPFVLEQKRPNKTRFEIVHEKQKSMRIFDGATGWKVRVASGARPELQAYTVDEVNFARDVQVIDGPLLDHAAKGITIALGGIDEIEGRKAYRLEVLMPSGLHQRAWIDAETFLDVQWERGAVRMQYRKYHDFNGLQIPLVIETQRAGGAVDRLTIDKIALNPPLTDREFAKPPLPGAQNRRGVTVDARVTPPR